MIHRYNSTIKIKVGKCIDCGPDSIDQPLTAKRCDMHYRAHRHAVNRDRDKIRGLAPEDPITRNKAAKTLKDVELEKWFDYIATLIKAHPYCRNCDTPIPIDYYAAQNDKTMVRRLLRSSSAHIFPKSLFPSVATHPLNHLIIGAGCGCHPTFDHSLDKACEMRIWPLAVERFRKFEHEIKETHKYLDLFKSKM